MKRYGFLVVCVLSLAGMVQGAGEAAGDVTGLWDGLRGCDVVWGSPSEDSSGSMPGGNGDIGINAWVEPTGELKFYISKTDSWDENGRLVKLGRVRMYLDPNPFMNAGSFEQRLHLAEGVIVLRSESAEGKFELRLWVDANRPVVWVETTSTVPVTVKCQLELWRTGERELSGIFSQKGSESCQVIEYPDTVVKGAGDRVVWYHRNEHTTYPAVLKNQHLEGFSDGKDPLLGRTFGGCIAGEGWVRVDDVTLATREAVKEQRLGIHVLTAQTEKAQGWVDQLGEQVAKAAAGSAKSAWESHQRWWREFWERSWVFVESGDHAQAITRGYTLQRYINACGGRGSYAIKFNGSIFTVDAREDDKEPAKREFFNADYRKWGGNYWFQNTRLPYWAMLASGDFDLMRPLFSMYRAALPMASYQTKQYFGHAGAFYPETMYFWGTYCNADFGWGNAGNTAVNPYVRYYWSGGIELTALMLDYYAMTGDEAFVREALLPIAGAVMTFYDQHWQRDGKGKIRFEPAASLETWHVAVNPLPEIAGLRYVLPQLIGLPGDLAGEGSRGQWRRMLGELPEVPIGAKGDAKVILPAEEFSNKNNCENPELYAVFPYRMYGVGKAGFELGLETYRRRGEVHSGGWQQTGIQAAYLGLARDASDEVVYNFTHKHPGSRFDGFWGPNYDWTPDQCHGNVGMIAVQRMLLQCEGEKMVLLPAWPKDWDVRFKLCGPKQTVIEGVYRGGKVEKLVVTPESRRADLKIMGFGT